jgi:hypothetical protein
VAIPFLYRICEVLACQLSARGPLVVLQISGLEEIHVVEIRSEDPFCSHLKLLFMFRVFIYIREFLSFKEMSITKPVVSSSSTAFQTFYKFFIITQMHLY